MQTSELEQVTVAIAYVPWARTKRAGSIKEGPILYIITPIHTVFQARSNGWQIAE
jgi:hypothetical protein